MQCALHEVDMESNARPTDLIYRPLYILVRLREYCLGVSGNDFSNAKSQTIRNRREESVETRSGRRWEFPPFDAPNAG